LFDRDQTRKPTLTAIGAAVLSEARTVSVGVDSRAVQRSVVVTVESDLQQVRSERGD